MAGTKELRLRIKALKNTSKITAAMKMVSAAKLKKAQDAHARNKPYAERMEEMLDRVLGAVEAPDHPLMRMREAKTMRYVLVSSDRGLCGGFNNGLFKAFSRRPADNTATQVLGIGRRARDFAGRLATGETIPGTFSNAPSYSNATAISKLVMDDFLEGKCDSVVLVYNRFRSVISQTPVFVPLLPVLPSPPAPLHRASEAGEGPGVRAAGGGVRTFRDIYLFEPDEKKLLESLLPRLVTLQVFRALLENAVGEHSARMTAMDNATKNTKELIASMSLTMNRARQAAITRELIEIVSGAEALKG
jgi:F-type H+-transporting ATPase subunit gamma